MYARKLQSEMPAADAARRAEDIRWLRYRRVAFLVAAAAVCWAVPILVAYLLTTA